MKRIILIVGASLLVGCGPSQEDKKRVAQVACSEIMATRNFEEARRISILNDALSELGEDPYYSSSLFEAQLVIGGMQACKDIINPPPPPTKAELKAREEVRIAAEEAKREAEEREKIAAEEAKREAEEREKYILENQISTYLYCPNFVSETGLQYTKNYFLFKINKLDEEDAKKYLSEFERKNTLNFVESEVYEMTPVVEIKNKFSSYDIKTGYKACSDRRTRSGERQPVSGPCWDNKNEYGKIKSHFSTGRSVMDRPYITSIRNEESSTYGHQVLLFADFRDDSSYRRNGYVVWLDTFDLIAAEDDTHLGAKGYGDYTGHGRYQRETFPCKKVSKETYELRIQEQEDLLADFVQSKKEEDAKRKAKREAKKSQL